MTIGETLADTALPDLFALGDIESKDILKAANSAHQALGELKGIVQTIPNQNILLHTLPLQEAKESSAIENIITTQDDLYQNHYGSWHFVGVTAKKVHYYAQAMQYGHREIRRHGLITLNLIKDIQKPLQKSQHPVNFR